MKDNPDAKPDTTRADAAAADPQKAGTGDDRQNSVAVPEGAARTGQALAEEVSKAEVPQKTRLNLTATPHQVALPATAPPKVNPRQGAGKPPVAKVDTPVAEPEPVGAMVAEVVPMLVAEKPSAPPKGTGPKVVSVTSGPKLVASTATPKTPSKVTALPSPKLSPAPPSPTGPKTLPGAGMPSFSGAYGARVRKRHIGLVLSLVLMVFLPAGASAWYLWKVALDQYSSNVGFSVQKEESTSAIELLGGITQLSGRSTSDTDILYKFIQSRELVRTLQDRLNLVAMYSRPEDPLFSMPKNPTIEDIESHWNRKVDIFYDTSSHLIEVRVLAFDPQDALKISEAIYAESTRMLNDLSAVARADATQYAKEELATALTRLKSARQALTAFRVRTQIVDPAADVQGRMGLLNTLLAQQASALIDLDLLGSNTSTSDPRYLQAQRRVQVIEDRINAERSSFGDKPAEEDQRYADLVAEFEALSVDMEFAQQAYLTALAAYNGSVADAQRKSRYLATYQRPTLAERSQFPQRNLIFGLSFGFLFAIWSISVLVFYTLRDRR